MALLKNIFFRVAATAKELDISVDLTPLYRAISKLYDATERLEKEKLSAKKALLKSLKRWGKRHSCLRSLWSRICRTLKKWKLGGCKDKDDDESEMFNEGLAYRLFDSDHHRLPHYVKKAIKRVRKVNSNLASFEAGFISEEGLPGRDWYRHFGVAPGKRLGYAHKYSRLGSFAERPYLDMAQLLFLLSLNLLRWKRMERWLEWKSKDYRR